MDYSALIGALAGAAVLLAGKGIEWYMARSKTRREEAADRLREEKQRAEVSIPINEQAVRVYKDIIDSLRKDMDKLMTSLDVGDKLLLECREEKVRLKAQAEHHREELDLLRRRVAELERRPS